MPKHFIYIIDAYKFETIVIGLLSLVCVGLSFISTVDNAHAASQNRFIGAPYESYPRGKSTIAPVQAAIRSPNSTAWPLNGIVTTEFGVPHYPWQRTHSGIDISSARSAGTAPVTAFRAGTVIETIYSYSGYGNHVAIDHGNGVTSLYAHLSSIAVSRGQVVQSGDILGREGSTGASTGAHLHFEIKVNGQPVNPRGHIPGSP